MHPKITRYRIYITTFSNKATFYTPYSIVYPKTDRFCVLRRIGSTSADRRKSKQCSRSQRGHLTKRTSVKSYEQQQSQNNPKNVFSGGTYEFHSCFPCILDNILMKTHRQQYVYIRLMNCKFEVINTYKWRERTQFDECMFINMNQTIHYLTTLCMVMIYNLRTSL